jgi:hypothetical protein
MAQACYVFADARLGAAPLPSLSTSGETLTIEVSVNLEGENGARQDVGHHDERSWSWA